MIFAIPIQNSPLPCDVHHPYIPSLVPRVSRICIPSLYILSLLQSLTSRIYSNNQVLFVHQNAHNLAKKQLTFPLHILEVIRIRRQELQALCPSSSLKLIRFPQWQMNSGNHPTSRDIVPHHLASRHNHITWHHPTSSHIIPHFPITSHISP